MAYDEKVAQRHSKMFLGNKDVVEKKMFGGIAHIYRDHMCWDCRRYADGQGWPRAISQRIF